MASSTQLNRVASFASFLFLLSAAWQARSDEPGGTSQERPAVIVHEANIEPISSVVGRAFIDLGKVKPDESVTARLLLTNKMPIVLELDKAIAGCSCLNVAAIQEVVPPDGVFAVQIDFKPQSGPDNFRMEQSVVLGRHATENSDTSTGSGTLSQDVNLGLVRIAIKYQLEKVLHFKHRSISKEFKTDEQLPVAIHLPIVLSDEIDPSLIVVKRQADISAETKIVKHPEKGKSYAVELKLNELPPKGERRSIEVRMHDPQNDLVSSMVVTVFHQTEIQLFPSVLIFNQLDDGVWQATVTLKQNKTKTKTKSNGLLAAAEVKASLDGTDLPVSLNWLSNRIGKATVRIEPSKLNIELKDLPKQGVIDWNISVPILGVAEFQTQFARRDKLLPLSTSSE